MELQALIQTVKKNRKRIEKEYKTLEAFQRKNPWHVLSVLEQLKEDGEENIPTFDQVISFKEEYILDDLSKVYHQLKKHNPYLITTRVGKVYVYTLQEKLYASQLKKGFALGEKDNRGRLVTGSDLTIEISTINIKEFLEMYYTEMN